MALNILGQDGSGGKARNAQGQPEPRNAAPKKTGIDGQHRVLEQHSQSRALLAGGNPKRACRCYSAGVETLSGSGSTGMAGE